MKRASLKTIHIFHSALRLGKFLEVSKILILLFFFLILLPPFLFASSSSISLNPEAFDQNACSIRAHGQNIYLQVTDARTNSQIVINRKDEKSKKINIEGDVVRSFDYGLRYGLMKCGYLLQAGPLPDISHLHISLQYLNIETIDKFWSDQVMTRGKARVVIKKGDKEMSAEIQTSQTNKRALGASTKRISRWINEAFNDLILKIITDPAVNEFLLSK